MSSVEPRPRVLVVDDELALAEMVADGLCDRGFDAVALSSGQQCLERLEREPFDALVTDLRMRPVDGLALLARSKALDPQRPVLLMTAFSAVDSAVEAIRQGASYYLAKPFKVDELALFLSRALDERRVRLEAATLRRALGGRAAPPGIVGKGPAMRRVFEVVARVADTDAPVLLLGETGTGKGLLAATLHARSGRHRGPFVAVNCAALPEALLESELFGHVRGAFTGATSNRAGLFAEAQGGTLLLDEVGELPLALQAKLLHVLERGRVRPVGGSKELEIDARLLAATHRDLRARVREGTFREDLLYRLDVVSLTLPPLRARPEDLPELFEHFLQSARARYAHSPVRTLTREALAAALRYAWPGNVRELAHAAERLVLLGAEAAVSAEELQAALPREDAASAPPAFTSVVPLREHQRRYAQWAFEQCGRNRTRTAEKLGIDFKTLARLLDAEP